MLEMPIRAGRRVQDVTRQIREGFDRRTGERQQVNSLHRQRMTCSDTVRSYTNTQDWTAGMSMSPSGRMRAVEQVKQKRKAFSKDGIRWNVAWIMLAGVIFLCMAILLADIAGMGIGSRSVGRLQNKISDQTRRNAKLQEELDYCAGDVSVCTEAVKLNLISGYGAQTISLTVPQELSSGAVTAEVRTGNAGWITGFSEN